MNHKHDIFLFESKISLDRLI